MIVLLAALATLLVAGYVLLPALKGHLPSSLERLGWDWRGRRDDLLARRESLQAAVRELETDRRSGRVDGETFERMRADYTDQMARLLQELDVLEADVEAYIEGRVAELRRELES